ncbi:MAG: DJ-1/PfpI family protein [Bacilli bacterium]|jgi:4-methyl-5(b-hydroxyethyl)-thiazole monophosphate biosynthesis|nr:DJ-1/PfpI family protein [Bacilli bacterium]
MKIAMFMNDGFEDSEALVTRDLLIRAGLEVDTIALFETKDIISSHNLPIKVDYLLDDVRLSSYDVFILPGGKGSVHYYQSNSLSKELKQALKEHKTICAICAAPAYLAAIGLLKGYRATCYPSFEKELIENDVTLVKDGVVVDDNIITAQGMGVSFEFGLTIIKELISQNKMEDIAHSICY